MNIYSKFNMLYNPICFRGIKEKTTTESLKKRFEEYGKFKDFLGIEPLLDSLLSPYFLIKL